MNETVDFERAFQSAFAGRLMVCTTWNGGAKAVANVDFQPLVGHGGIIWLDNEGQGGQNGIGFGAAARFFRGTVDILCPPSVFPEGWTFGRPLPKKFDPWELQEWAIPYSRFADIARLKFPCISGKKN